tara:strand:+ start:313 stop:1389 length:1077 start_codon:yes stop_codon:yes gene_type:complete
MATFRNSPSHSVGEDFVVGQESSTSSGSGSDYFYYAYHQYGDHSTENYQYGDDGPGVTVHRESFHYYSDPSTGLVGDVSQYVDEEVYDSNQRKSTRDSASIHQYNYGDSIGTETASFAYIDSSSSRLSSSTMTRGNTYTDYENDYSDYSFENITYTYDYTGLSDSEIYSEYDYSTRWGEGTRIHQNSYGTDESFDLYSREDRSRNRNSEERQELKIETSESGFIINAFASSDQFQANGSAYSNMHSSDHDQDGIIDSRHEYSQRYKGDNYSSISIDKQDYDGDGQADYIFMSRERGSRSGTQRTEYRYDTQSANRPILEISKFSNGQVTSENSVFRTLTSRHTDMGEGHVVELADVLA